MPSPVQEISNADAPPAIPGLWLIVGIGASIAGLLAAMAQTRLTIDPFAPATGPFWLFGIMALALRVTLAVPNGRWQRLARDGSEHFGLFALVTLVGVLASYPAAADSRGFVVGSICSIDRLLHFDWIMWYATVAAHPALQLIGRFAYESIFVSPALLLGYFTIAGRKAEARRFIAGFWLAVVLTLLLFAYMPAEGPLATLWHGPIPYMPCASLAHIGLILELRHHALHQISLADLHGLVCTPSFHAASAILYISAAWPIRQLRWPLAVLNVAMLLATPVEGTHYLTDMIAGAAVAAVALLAITALDQQFRRRSSMPAGRTTSATMVDQVA